MMTWHLNVSQQPQPMRLAWRNYPAAVALSVGSSMGHMWTLRFSISPLADVVWDTDLQSRFAPGIIEEYVREASRLLR